MGSQSGNPTVYRPWEQGWTGLAVRAELHSGTNTTATPDAAQRRIVYTWFWWGGRKGPDGFQALYRMTFDRLVNYHRLNNLIWVWNANAPNGKNPGPYYDYYPGAQYVDIHDDLVELAAGKPIALGEIGRPPSLEVLKASRSGRGSWGRRNIFDRQATDAHKALFSDPRTLSRGDKLPEPQP